jgi:ribose-phosphate pyrophosphokinase
MFSFFVFSIVYINVKNHSHLFHSRRSLFSPPAIERLSGGIFEEVIVTNSILLPEDKCFPQLTVLSMANLVAETIWHVHRDGSVSSIFQ